MKTKIIKFIPVVFFLFSANFAFAAGYDFYVNAGSAETEEDGTEKPVIDPIPGNSLTIKNGPNKGDYIIDSFYKFKYYYATDSIAWVYFIKIKDKIIRKIHIKN